MNIKGREVIQREEVSDEKSDKVRKVKSEEKWEKMRISADIYSIQTALFSECSKAEPR